MYKSLFSLHLAILLFFLNRGRRFAVMQLNVKFLRKETKCFPKMIDSLRVTNKQPRRPLYRGASI